MQQVGTGTGQGRGEGGPCVEPKVGRGVPLLGNLGLCLNLDAPSFGRAAGRVAGGTSSNHQRLAQSSGKRTLIPIESGQGFQSKADT